MDEDLPVGSEEIPDLDQLYHRYHRIYYTASGLIRGSCFKIKNNIMSTNWSRYSSPEETRNQAKIPSDNGVIEMNVGDVRNIEFLGVFHTPKLENHAHTDIIGFENYSSRADLNEVRIFLANVSRWVIKL